MKNILEYKGYYAKIEYSAEDSVLYGKIEGIKDLVNFESESASEIAKEFHEAVDDYLEFCENVGKEPDKAYKGTFNVRISPSLHRQLAIMALKNGESLNQTVERALQKYANNPSKNKTCIENRMGESISTLNEIEKYGGNGIVRLWMTPDMNECWRVNADD